MKKTIKIHARLLAVSLGAAALMAPLAAPQAASILELDRGAYGYGHLTDSNANSGGSGMGSILNASNTVSQADNLLGDLSSYNAIWVSNNKGADLSSAEIANLQAFISGGGKAVLIGDATSAGYASWNAGLAAVVGGGIASTSTMALITAPIVPIGTLTEGVSQIRLKNAGTLDNSGEVHMLFDQPIAAEYNVGDGEALVMLDTDWMTNGSAGLWRLDNTLFANNISDWINDDDIFSRAAAAPTPEPATMAIFGAALLGLAGIRRRKR